MKNCIFANKSVSGSSHPLFSQVHLLVNDHHNHNTRFASNGLQKISTNNTSAYGTKSFATPNNNFLELFSVSLYWYKFK